MGIPALHSRIDSIQREDQAVAVAEVRVMIDGTIEYTMKVSAKKLSRRFDEDSFEKDYTGIERKGSGLYEKK